MCKMQDAEDKSDGSLPKEMTIATPQIVRFDTPSNFNASLY